MPIPILFYGDAPDLPSGLGRIMRDLATLLSRSPHFRVGTYGRGGIGSSQLPFSQYLFSEWESWGERRLPAVWDDFAGKECGIIFTVWDASRLFLFGAPHTCQNADLKRFLTSGRFRRWGYFPVDATGPGDRLSILSRQALADYDRVLAYSKFGKGVLERSRARVDDFIPHGIDQNVFRPRDRNAGRLALNVDKDDVLVGVVMTNQQRKSWGLWAEIAAMLPRVHWWLQADLRERYWNMDALIEDFGLADRIHFGKENATDEDLSYYYSACDLTILPSLGEGFGYPIVESLSCGIPVVHHNYAAGAEIIPPEMTQVMPTGYHLDTINNVYRPEFNAAQWSAAIETQLDRAAEWPTERCREATRHLWWENLAPVWMNWFEKGLI